MRLSVLVAILTLTAFVRADSHSGRGPYYAFYHFCARSGCRRRYGRFSASECRQGTLQT